MKLATQSFIMVILISAWLGSAVRAQQLDGAPAGAASHLTSSKSWARGVGNYLSRRLESIYGGAEQIDSILRSGNAIRGMIGLKGNVLGGPETIVDVLPFQVELNTDGTKQVTLSLLQAKLPPRDHQDFVGQVRIINFSYDDRVQGRMDRKLTFDIDLVAPIKEWSRGWVGPAVYLNFGARKVAYESSGVRGVSDPSVRTLVQTEDQLYRGMKLGVAFDKKFLAYSIRGFAGLQVANTGTLSPAETEEQAAAASAGALSALSGQIVSRQFPLELDLSRPLARQGGSLGVIYRGNFFRDAQFRGTFDDRTYDITDIELIVAHQAGIVYKFRR